MIGRRTIRRPIRPTERGSAVIMVVIWVALAIGATGAISYFEAVATLKRMEAQTRAESLALGAALSTRVYGPENRCEGQYIDGFLNKLHELNGGEGAAPCPNLETRQAGELTSSFGLDATESADVKAKLWHFNVDATVQRGGRALRIYELVATDEDFERELGNIELLLDFSRSMREDNKFSFLQSAIREFLDEGVENVKVGVVGFATDILLDRPLVEGPAPTSELNDAVQAANVGTAENGNTNYHLGINRAIDRLTAEPVGGRTIIFISDGKPTEPQPEPEAIRLALEAGRSAVAAEIDMFGLFVGQANEAATMRDVIDGGQGLGADVLDNRFLVNANPDQIAAFFDQLVIDFVCRLPISEALEPGFPASDISAWIRTNAPEPGIPIQRVEDLNEMFGDYNDPITGDRRSRADDLKFAILEAPPGAGGVLSLYVSKAVCLFLETEGNDLAFRAGFARSADLAAEL